MAVSGEKYEATSIITKVWTMWSPRRGVTNKQGPLDYLLLDQEKEDNHDNRYPARHGSIRFSRPVR